MQGYIVAFTKYTNIQTNFMITVLRRLKYRSHIPEHSVFFISFSPPPLFTWWCLELSPGPYACQAWTILVFFRKGRIIDIAVIIANNYLALIQTDDPKSGVHLSSMGLLLLCSWFPFIWLLCCYPLFAHCLPLTWSLVSQWLISPVVFWEKVHRNWWGFFEILIKYYHTHSLTGPRILFFRNLKSLL
jgi:hypothetical protein